MGKKKILIVASVVSFIEWFNKENIDFLNQELGCEVHVACNLEYMKDTDEARTKAYIEKIRKQGVVLHQIPFSRSPFALKNGRAYRLLKTLIDREGFSLVHCHTPTASMLTRLAARSARKRGCSVMYTCHGFHFHKAAPKKNWLLYYPIEKWLSRYSDCIVTINREDYARAKTFHCPCVRYIPSVGVDIHRIKNAQVDKEAKREEIGVPAHKTLILSVGELIPRKNHQVIIRAVAKLQDPNIFYAIAGKGPLAEKLAALARRLGVADQVLFLGFRTDVAELYHVADISAFPSRIEGLGLAGVEAMAAGVPLVSSNVHGILDYVIDGKTGFALAPNDVNGYAEAIRRLADNPQMREQMKEDCYRAVEPFEIKNALRVMWDIYEEFLCEEKLCGTLTKK